MARTITTTVLKEDILKKLRKDIYCSPLLDCITDDVYDLGPDEDEGEWKITSEDANSFTLTMHITVDHSYDDDDYYEDEDEDDDGE